MDAAPVPSVKAPFSSNPGGGPAVISTSPVKAANGIGTVAVKVEVAPAEVRFSPPRVVGTVKKLSKIVGPEMGPTGRKRESLWQAALQGPKRICPGWGGPAPS